VVVHHEKLQDNPLTGRAAALTEEEFAGVFNEMVHSRKEATATLVNVLQEAVRGHNNIGLYRVAPPCLEQG
jgi:hypothetical protein